MSAEDRDLVDVQLKLSRKTLDDIKRLFQDQDDSGAQVITRAVAIEKFIRDAVLSGKKVLIKEKDGKFKEIHFFP
jgi:hypothetical protein